MPGLVWVAAFAAMTVGSRVHTAETFEVTKADAEWRALLTEVQYALLRDGFFAGAARVAWHLNRTGPATK